MPSARDCIHHIKALACPMDFSIISSLAHNVIYLCSQCEPHIRCRKISCAVMCKIRQRQGRASHTARAVSSARWVGGYDRAWKTWSHAPWSWTIPAQCGIIIKTACWLLSAMCTSHPPASSSTCQENPFWRLAGACMRHFHHVCCGHCRLCWSCHSHHDGRHVHEVLSTLNPKTGQGLMAASPSSRALLPLSFCFGVSG